MANPATKFALRADLKANAGGTDLEACENFERDQGCGPGRGMITASAWLLRPQGSHPSPTPHVLAVPNCSLFKELRLWRDTPQPSASVAAFGVTRIPRVPNLSSRRGIPRQFPAKSAPYGALRPDAIMRPLGRAFSRVLPRPRRPTKPKGHSRARLSVRPPGSLGPRPATWHRTWKRHPQARSNGRPAVSERTLRPESTETHWPPGH